mgnify:CR=1 FL=1
MSDVDRSIDKTYAALERKDAAGELQTREAWDVELVEDAYSDHLRGILRVFDGQRTCTFYLTPAQIRQLRDRALVIDDWARDQTNDEAASA